MASFTRQDVVSAAGRVYVHGFNANLALDEGCQPGGAREANAITTSKNDQFSTQSRQLSKVQFAQVVKLIAGPVKALAARTQHGARGDFFSTDTDPTGAIAANGLHVN